MPGRNDWRREKNREMTFRPKLFRWGPSIIENNEFTCKAWNFSQFFVKSV